VSSVVALIVGAPVLAAVLAMLAAFSLAKAIDLKLKRMRTARRRRTAARRRQLRQQLIW
jgi:phosphate/sulfate permease